jgi:nucleotide-binding universal stress UspA family protein
MKILVAYDGSKHAEAALDDLSRAGLPASGEFLTVSVAEVWLPAPGEDEDPDAATNPYIEKLVKERRARSQKIVEGAEHLASAAAERVSNILPGWKAASRATYGSAAWALLDIAGEYEPDLIVVGSQGLSAVSRVFLGSVSLKVAAEARCSVRVARGRNETEPSPIRVIVGFDGSTGSESAASAAAGRDWPEGTEIKLVAASDPISPTIIGQFAQPITAFTNENADIENEMIRKAAEPALKKLSDAGHNASLEIIPGSPKNVLVDEAEKWSADSIFIGATALQNRLERILIGSTASAVASRAGCSVEIVR